MVVAKPMNPEINVFLDSIKDVKFLQPDGNPLPEWKLFLAPTLFDSWGALYEATKHHSRDAIRETTQNAIHWALRNDDDVDFVEGTVRSAVWRLVSDATDAFRATVKDSDRERRNWASARGVAWNASQDAALYAAAVLAAGHIDPEHLEYARRRWKVWVKGYGVYCDVDGVLYVYGVGR